ncbi:restriction endonuclease [Chloroflexota bacterium]
MNTEKKWLRFEKLVAKIQQELAPNAVVTHDDNIRGHDSRVLRQIDITVKQNIGQYEMLIAIDCKDTKVPVDVKDIEGFIGFVKDIRANKGVMVAANGFTDTAKRIGGKAGLNLYRLIDTEAHDWQTYCSIPVICDFRGIRFQFIIPKFLASVDPREIVLYNSSHNRLGTTKALLLTRWNSGELPSELGEHKNIPVSKVPTKVSYEGQFREANILANIMVKCRLFFGELPLIQVRGFADEYNGQLLTRGFTTDWLNVTEVERDWRQLASLDEVAIIPIFILTALDLFDITTAS